MGITDRRYTKITRDQVVDDLSTITQAKLGPLADIGQSAYGRMLIELFAANSDLNAAWIEEAFKDSFLDTATSPQAIYVGARSLGYSVRRPTPAKAGLGISLKRTGVFPNVKVAIPKETEFSFGGQVLTAIDDMEFVFDRNDPKFEDGVMRLVSGRAVMAEGTFKTVQFFSDGSQNQEFIINDTTFSDWFGPNDPNYTDPDRLVDRSGRFTVVSSDASLIDNPDVIEGLEDKVLWRISRRGFHDPAIDVSTINEIEDFVENSTTNRTVNYTVQITTGNDGRAKLEFSDGIISAIPFGVIDVRYFSTSGETGNLLNVAGSDMDTESSNILITQIDGSESDLSVSDLNIALTTDIRGGLNLESLVSIKKNAPQIYNSLDSLGNRSSYLLFLQRTSDVKYGNAFGEDILNKIQKNRQNGAFDIRYSNVVRFTLLKDLYREKEGNFFITDPFEYFLEGYKVNGLTYLWDYDYSDLPSIKAESVIENEVDNIARNIKDLTILDENGVEISRDDFIFRYILPSSVENQIPTVFTTNLTPKDFVEPGSEIDGIMDSLNTKGYLTLGSGQHQYVPPIVHEMSMTIDAILFEGSNFTDIKTQMINAIYSFLKEETQFASSIFRSRIESIVQRLPDVAGLNLHFKEKSNEFQGLQIDKLEWLGEETAQFINQQGISIDGFSATLEYNFRGSETTSITPYDVLGETQEEVRNVIKNYYIGNFTQLVDGVRVPINNITEEQLNSFTALIWSTSMNAIYNTFFNMFLFESQNGNAEEADKLFNILEALRGWFFVSGKLNFKDTDAIDNMVEGTDNTLANYKTYTLEYVKLVRNVLGPIIARNLIDEDGNITNYSSKNEIVQFSISSTDITITTQNNNILAGS